MPATHWSLKSVSISLEAAVQERFSRPLRPELWLFASIQRCPALISACPRDEAHHAHLVVIWGEAHALRVLEQGRVLGNAGVIRTVEVHGEDAGVALEPPVRRGRFGFETLVLEPAKVRRLAAFKGLEGSWRKGPWPKRRNSMSRPAARMIWSIVRISIGMRIHSKMGRQTRARHGLIPGGVRNGMTAQGSAHLLHLTGPKTRRQCALWPAGIITSWRPHSSKTCT